MFEGMGKKGLNDILGSFNKAKTELSEFLVDNTKKADELTIELDKINTENAKADKVLTNISKLLGEDK